MNLSGAILTGYYYSSTVIPTIKSASFAPLTALKSVTITNIAISNGNNYSILRNGTVIASKLITSSYTDITMTGDNTQYTYTIVPYYNSTPGTPFLPTGGSGNGAIYTLANPSNLSLTRNDANGSATSVNISWVRNANNYASLVVQDSNSNALTTITYSSGSTNYTISSLSPNTIYSYKVYVVNGDGVGNNLSLCLATVNTCTWATINTFIFINTAMSTTTISCGGTFNGVNISYTPNNGLCTPASGTNINTANSITQVYDKLFPGTTYIFNISPINQYSYTSSNYASNSVTTSSAISISGYSSLQNLGNYTVVTITGNTTITPTRNYSTNVLLIGGGGAGGGSLTKYYEPGGGGGAGAIIKGTISFVYNTTYTITIGDGGIAVNNAVVPGGNSIISANGFTTLTAKGGGGGGYQTSSGGAGGSGGGAGGKGVLNGGTSQLPVSGFTVYANKGGNSASTPSPTSITMSGGGGGASSAGYTTSTKYLGANGGDGFKYLLDDGTNMGYFADGGGGGASSTGGGSDGAGNTTGGVGGSGKTGGTGGYHNNYNPVNGGNASPNTGSGGGGGCGGTTINNVSQMAIGGNGGSGICIFSFLPPDAIKPAICLNFDNNTYDTGLLGVTVYSYGSGISFTTNCVRGTNAIAFSGNNISNNASKSNLSFTASLNFPYTVCVWLNMTSAPTGNNSWIDMVTPNNTVFSTYNSSLNRIGTFTGGIPFFQSPSDVNYNTWYHYAYVINSVNSASTYINGQLVKTDSVVPNFSSSSPQNITFELGWARTQATMYNNPGFEGYMDQFLVYNYALNGQQISDLYNNNITVF